MRATVIALVGVVVMASGCGGSPHSLADAIAKRKSEFPANSLVLIPPADLPRLGETVVPLDGRRAQPTGTKCFDVAAVTGKGLEKIELSYEAGVEFQAEVNALAAKAGATVTNNDKATIALLGLQVVEGIGIPNRNSACGFRDGDQTVNVITATVVAGTAKIEFSRNLSFSASGGGGWSPGAASGGGSANGNVTQSGTLQGTNIVLTGSVTPVNVHLKRTEQDLGVTPAIGSVVTFPSEFDGNARIDALDTATPDHIPVLTITPNTQLDAGLQNVPAELKVCKPGESTSIKPGTGCFIWDRSGASGVNIWFEPRDVGGATHIVLHADGYRTTFVPRAGG